MTGRSKNGKEVTNMILESSKIKGVIWDVDGTLLDSMPIWEDMSGRYLREMGIEPRDDLADKVLHMTIDEGVHYVKETYHLALTEPEIKDGLLSLIRHFYYEEAQFKPGAEALIYKLKELQIPMNIATSGDIDLAGHALERLGVRDCFRTILSSNNLNTNKSQPYIFYLAALNLLGRTKAVEWIAGQREILAQLFIIEDSVVAARTAKKAGFSVIAVEDNASRSNWEELRSLADIYVSSLTEIIIR